MGITSKNSHQSPSRHRGEDLYPLYVQYMLRLREEIVETMPPCSSRRHNLRACRTAPREHFELRLNHLRQTSHDFDAVVDALKRCDPLGSRVVLA